MAETIEVSAVARVIDLASGPLKAVQAVITGLGATAKQATSAFASMSSNVAGTASSMVGGLKGAAGQMMNFGKQMAGMFGPLSGLTGLAGIGGMTAAVTSFISACQELDKASRALHLNTDALQAFRNAAGGPEAASTALGNLQKTLGLLKEGGKDVNAVGELLHKMGVSAKEIADGNLDAILPKIAEGFRVNINPAQQLKAAIALFGEEVGPKLLPFLSKGAAGMKELSAEAARLGISVKDLQAGLQAGEALDALSKSVTGARNAIGAAILPAFVPMVKAITDFVNSNRELLSQVALPAFLGLITTALISLGVAIAGVLGPWGLLVGAIVAAGVAIYQNWDKVVAFFDSTLPGFLPALEEAGAGIASWAKQASADITAGFQTGGISGGLAAIWQVFQTGWTDSIAWLTKEFSSIDWNKVGTDSANLMWAGMVALFNSQVSLGQIILDKFNAVDWSQLGTDILNGIGTMYSKAGDLLAQLRGLDWQSVGAAIGTFLIDAMLAYFKAAVAIDVWLVELVQKIGTAFANADWSAIGKSILKYFAELALTIVSIGYDLIAGLIKGMWSAIPGLDAIVDGIKGKLAGIGDWFSNLGKGGDEWVRRQFPSTAGGSPNLLQQPGAAAPRADVNSNTNITIGGLPPGATVKATSTTNGQPGGVNVGPNGAGVGSQ